MDGSRDPKESRDQEWTSEGEQGSRMDGSRDPKESRDQEWTEVEIRRRAGIKNGRKSRSEGEQGSRMDGSRDPKESMNSPTDRQKTDFRINKSSPRFIEAGKLNTSLSPSTRCCTHHPHHPCGS